MATVEQQLLESLNALEALLAAVVDHSIVVITDSDGQITFANDRFCALSKYSREELLGNNLQIVNSKHHPPEFIRELWTTIKAGLPWHGEFRNRAKDGSYFWVEMSIFPQLNAEGQLLQYIAICSDITERVSLRKTSDAFETVMKNATDFIYFKDRHSRFVRASRSILQRFGLSHLDELRGKTDLDFFSEEHALVAAADEQAIIRNNEPILDKEEKETRRDGQVSWALSSKMPWHDKDGNVIGIMGVSKDITELKHAKQEAAQWEARFKFLLDSLPLGISWAHVADDGHIALQLINDEHLSITGLTREEARNWLNFRRITHPEDSERQDTFRFEVAQGKRDRFSMEKRYLMPDGRTVSVLYSYRTRTCEDGSFEDLSSVVDITERKAAEEKLRVTELLFHLAGQMSSVGAWIVELPDRAMRWTEEAYRIHEAAPDYEPTLERAIEFYAPECREVFRNAFEACVRDGTSFNLDLEMVTTAGRRISVRTMGLADIQGGQTQRVLGAMQEIAGNRG